MPNDRGVVRGHTPTIGTNRVEGDRASLAPSCPLPRHATFVLCVPGVTCPQIEGAPRSHPRNKCSKMSCRDSGHEEMPNYRGVVRGHTPTIGTDHVARGPAML